MGPLYVLLLVAQSKFNILQAKPKIFDENKQFYKSTGIEKVYKKV